MSGFLAHSQSIPLFSSTVSAGFPNTAEDMVEQGLNLHEHLVKKPAATYFLRVCGNSMINAGIHSGDLLIVDRSLEPKDGNVVIASLDREFTVKRLRFSGGKYCLYPENPAYKPIFLDQTNDIEVWGVVISVIHSLI
ncbi:translesion error-prone DNA polymerase V autoproteolytic subunit [Candidatus Nomurabacteria bacterium]|nr:translesion error-prone DNA polymerase V autoproteolytic subunit [Candidatus Nomurabacteria bacterium]